MHCIKNQISPLFLNIKYIQRSIRKRGVRGEFCKILSFILIAIVSLHACTSKPSDNTGSASVASSSKTKQAWLANMNDAYAQSVKDHKPILAYFSASDTCGVCKQLETNVFSTSTFKEWAETYVVLLEIDFSKHNQLPDGSQEQNTAMAQYLKVTSYPTIWILNVTHEAENGRFKVKPIGKAPIEQSPEKFVGMLQNFVRR